MNDELLLDLDAARVGGTTHQGHLAGATAAALASPGGPACDLAPPRADGDAHAAPHAANGNRSGPPALDGLCADRLGAPEAGPQDERCIADALDAGVLRRRNGEAHPLKPRTDAQKARFAAIWADLAIPLATIAVRYRASERTIQNWKLEMMLPPRDQLRDQRSRRQPWAVRAAGWQAGPPGPASGGTVGHADPLADAEIMALLTDLGAEARRIRPGTDLAAISRKLARLSLVVATKAPAQTWGSLEERATALARATLAMRKVEAELPPPEADQAQLRREAAAQMMRELKTVLSDDEQAELARLVKMGADRLVAARTRGD